MNFKLFLNHEYIYSIISLAVTIIGFLLFHFITNSGRLNNKFQILFGVKKAMEYRIYFRQITGFIFFALLPSIVFFMLLPQKITDYGIDFSIDKMTVIYIIVLSGLIITMNFFASRNPGNLKKYPLIRTKVWNIKLLILSSMGWIIYLISYEFLFRGFLLFSCVRAFDMWPAIIINILIYSFVHIPQGLKEAIGAIPFGIILCFITLLSGNIWPAVILHVVLAISNEWFSILNNPEITLKLSHSE